MGTNFLRATAALASGLVFGLGLAVSGMMNPDKVIGFLDVAGDWDPTLAFVMVGALLVAVPATASSRGAGVRSSKRSSPCPKKRP
jgi:uncharacterized membrane protein YedE/YeeE